jgi:hypothetical protein
MPLNYENSKVYKIWSPNGDKIYIGSTTKQYLSQRMTAHRKDYNYWKSGKGHFITSYLIFDEYGLDNCSIELLEAKPCSSKDELKQLEGGYIRNLTCVNKRVENRNHVESIQNYREQNREKYLEGCKKYRENNKDKIKEYTEDNKDKIKEYSKQWREENKEVLKEKKLKYIKENHEELIEKKKEIMTCECCGKTYKRSHKSDHLKSKYHLNNKKE